MRQSFLIIAFCLASAVCADERGTSIMFTDKQQDASHLTSAPDQAKSRGDRCEEMAREITRLKGQPQRKFTMQERFKAECEGN